MDDLNYDQTKIFKFNLIPPKTKEEINVLVERDNSTLYAFLLVFFGMLVLSLLTLFQAIIVTPRVVTTNAGLSNQDNQLTSYNSIKKLNGELFVKSKALQPILDKDIKITQLLNISNVIIQQIPSAHIISYARENTGEFVLTFVLNSFEQSQTLFQSVKSQTQVNNVFLRSVVKDPNLGTFQAIISFNLTNKNG